MKGLIFHWRLSLSIILGFQILALLSLAWALGGALVVSQSLEHLLLNTRLIVPLSTVIWLIVQVLIIAVTASLAKWIAGDILASRVMQVLGAFIIIGVLMYGMGLIAPLTGAG